MICPTCYKKVKPKRRMGFGQAPAFAWHDHRVYVACKDCGCEFDSQQDPEGYCLDCRLARKAN